MNDRREKLLEAVCGKDFDGNSAAYAEAVTKIILGDMKGFYQKLWQAKGPGVMVLCPNSEKSMFWLTFEELNVISEKEEGEVAETFKTILESAQKIDPESAAGYLIQDHQGMRYFQPDYNRITE